MADSRYLALRRADRCVQCGVSLDRGARAWWDAAARTVTCVTCSEVRAAPDLTAPIGRPGTSADHEHHRRLANDKARVRADHKHLGGLIWWLSKERTSTRVWGVGAEGERLV